MLRQRRGASTWNRELLRKIGKALAEESLAVDVSLLLGPGVGPVMKPLVDQYMKLFGSYEERHPEAFMSDAWWLRCRLEIWSPFSQVPC